MCIPPVPSSVGHAIAALTSFPGYHPYHLHKFGIAQSTQNASREFWSDYSCQRRQHSKRSSNLSPSFSPSMCITNLACLWGFLILIRNCTALLHQSTLYASGVPYVALKRHLLLRKLVQGVVTDQASTKTTFCVMINFKKRKLPVLLWHALRKCEHCGKQIDGQITSPFYDGRVIMKNSQ